MRLKINSLYVLTGLKGSILNLKQGKSPFGAAKQKSRDLKHRELKLIQEINACCNTQEILKMLKSCSLFKLNWTVCI